MAFTPAEAARCCSSVSSASLSALIREPKPRAKMTAFFGAFAFMGTSSHVLADQHACRGHPRFDPRAGTDIALAGVGRIIMQTCAKPM